MHPLPLQINVIQKRQQPLWAAVLKDGWKAHEEEVGRQFGEGVGGAGGWESWDAVLWYVGE